MKEFSLRFDDYFIEFKVVCDETTVSDRYLIIKNYLNGSGATEYYLPDQCDQINDFIKMFI